MYKKQKNFVHCLLMVGVSILDYLCPSPSVNLDSNETRVEIYNDRGAQVAKYPHANQHYTKQKVLLFVFHLQLVNVFSCYFYHSIIKYFIIVY